MGRSSLFVAGSRLVPVRCGKRRTEGSSVWANRARGGLPHPALGGRRRGLWRRGLWRRGLWRWRHGSLATSGVSAAKSGSC